MSEAKYTAAPALLDALTKSAKTIESLMEECRNYRIQCAAECEISANMDIATLELVEYRAAIAKATEATQ
jgi:hypothetical protein